MKMFVCLIKNKWVMSRCAGCRENCCVDHPATQEIGTKLYGAGFDKRPPAFVPEREQK